MSNHFKRVYSVIDQLPSKDNFNTQAPSTSTGLSQDLGSQLTVSVADSESLDMDKAERSTKATPDTSFSKSAPARRRKNPVK